MKPPIFVTDLDGTLLRPDATLSAYSADTLTSALDGGCIVSYATARSYRSSTAVVSAIPWKYPILLYNGALLFDPVERRVIGGYWLQREIADAIIGIGKSFGVTPYLFALDAADEERVLHEELVRQGELQFYRSRPGDPRFRQVERLRCPDDYRTLGLTYIAPFDDLEPLRAELAQTFGEDIHMHFMKDGYIRDHYFLELSHPRANKRDGLLLLAKRMRVEPTQITVFGDNLNDIGLFEAAGTRIAVANAHEELKRLADRVTGSNLEDGVAAVIAQAIGLDA